MPSTKPLRPGPPNEQTSSKILQPIYSAIDSRNYAKAIKLTTPPNNVNATGSRYEWDIVKALRIHALERSGKRRESLLLLWEVLASSSCGDERIWSELRSRIEAATEAAVLVDANNNCNAGGARLQLQLLDAVQKLDLACFAADAPKEGVVGAVKEADEGDKMQQQQSKPVGKGKCKGKGKAVSSSTATLQNLPPITDETVLQTLSVTLRIQGLVDTMSEMYHQAIAEASSNSTPQTVEASNEFGSILEEAVCVHFRAVCDCDPIQKNANSYSLRELQTQQKLTKYHERMQSTCLQLAKHTAEPLHFQWTAASGLWYKQSLEDMVCLLEYFRGKVEKDGEERLKSWLVHILGVRDANEIPEMCTTYKQKIGLLPRLTESVSHRVIQNKLNGNVPDKRQSPPLKPIGTFTSKR